MLNVEIQTIPHEQQEYNTVGFHREGVNKNIIRVSDLNNWKYEILIAIHELVEQSLCLAHGMKAKDVIDFDENFEKNRTSEAPLEPGDNLSAPYHKEHVTATFFEKEMAKALDIDWEDYCKKINDTYSKAIDNKIFG